MAYLDIPLALSYHLFLAERAAVNPGPFNSSALWGIYRVPHVAGRSESYNYTFRERWQTKTGNKKTAKDTEREL